MEDGSETEVRAEGGHGHGGYGCEVATVAAVGGMGGGGGIRRVLWREGRAACGRSGFEYRGVDGGGDGGCRALRCETAHRASRLGSLMLRWLAWMR